MAMQPRTRWVGAEAAGPRGPSPPTSRSPQFRTHSPPQPIPPQPPPPPPPPPPPVAEYLFCCSPAVETALFRLFACDLMPLGALIQSAMRGSAKEVAYFITDTAAFVVSKMWDDMLASEMFQTSTTFLCSDDAGRPCNRPPSAAVQFRYTALLLAACALIKAHIDMRSARHNRGALIIPVMLGMLVGWALGRSFLEVRFNLEALLLGCDKFVPRNPKALELPHAAAGAEAGVGSSPQPPPISTLETSPSPALGVLTGGAAGGGFVCENLTPSSHTVGFRLAYALALTVMSSLFILILEPAAALATFGRTHWRRAAGRHIRSLLQLLSMALSIVVMMSWNDAMTYWAEDGLSPAQASVKGRMLLFYSLAMTFGGSAVSLAFQRWSIHLSAVAAASADAATRQVSAKLVVDQQRSRMQRKVLTKLRSTVHAPLSVQRELDLLLDETRVAAGEAPSDVVCGLDEGTGTPQDSPPVAPPEAGLDHRGGGVAIPPCAGSVPRGAQPEDMVDSLGGSPPQILGAVAVIRARSEETAQRIQALGARIHKLKWRIYFVGVLLRMLSVLQETLGVVAGCAWAEFTLLLCPSIGEFPSTGWVLLKNLQVATLLSALAFTFFTFTGEAAPDSPPGSPADATRTSPRPPAADGPPSAPPPPGGLQPAAPPVGLGGTGARESRERIFLGGAFSFFTGFAWIAVVRCIWLTPYAYLGWSRGVSGPGRWLELLLTLSFCPIATLLVVRVALSTKNAYEARAGRSRWQRHARAMRALRVFGHAAAAAAAARHAARARLSERRSSAMRAQNSSEEESDENSHEALLPTESVPSHETP